MTVNLLDFDAEGLAAWFAGHGEKPFRARQVLRWMHRFGEDDFGRMTMSPSLRAAVHHQIATAGAASAPTTVRASSYLMSGP
jgi:23S rRNA (adenine2503-C2)-methyltransferase